MLLSNASGLRDTDLASQAKNWLEQKGFEVEEVLQQGVRTIVRAQEPTRWKRYIGASPSVEVRFNPVGHATDVQIGLVKAGAGVIAARYFTYSWVAMGVSFLSLKRELEEFLRGRMLDGKPANVTTPTILDVVETARVERALGTDTREIDNSGSDSEVTRSIRVSRRWLQRCTVETELLRKLGGGLDLKLADVVSLQGSVEKQVREHYSLAEEKEQVFEEQIGVTVPPRAKLIISMEWKRIVQQGRIRMLTPADQIIELPFEVDLGITFDQRQAGQRG